MRSARVGSGEHRDGEEQGAPASALRPSAATRGYLTEYAPLFAHGAKMRAIRDLLEEVAETTATVLIRGESGVGKDVVARAIHAASPRHSGPLIKVNCAALPTELLESELFGHEKGAFTGAYRRKLGKFEFANKGTLFLDEIGDLPRPLQAKLLHVLQDLQFCRIGGHELIQADVRMIGSTNRNLEQAMSAGDFREDLYYRLNVVEFWVPPLRDRIEEIPALAAFLLGRLNQQYHRSVTLTAETLDLLTRYAWPGNVRELDNLLRRLVVLGNPEQVQAELRARLHAGPLNGSVSRRQDPPMPLAEREGAPLGLKEIARRAARESERRALAEVLEQVRWNRTEAAVILKVSYKTLLNKITELGLAPARPRRRPGP